MNQNISDLIARIRELEEEVEREIASRRAQLHFTLEERKVRFEREVLTQHKRLKTWPRRVGGTCCRRPSSMPCSCPSWWRTWR